MLPSPLPNLHTLQARNVWLHNPLHVDSLRRMLDENTPTLRCLELEGGVTCPDLLPPPWLSFCEWRRRRPPGRERHRPLQGPSPAAPDPEAHGMRGGRRCGHPPAVPPPRTPLLVDSCWANGCGSLTTVQLHLLFRVLPHMNTPGPYRLGARATRHGTSGPPDRRPAGAAVSERRDAPGGCLKSPGPPRTSIDPHCRRSSGCRWSCTGRAPSPARGL